MFFGRKRIKINQVNIQFNYNLKKVVQHSIKVLGMNASSQKFNIRSLNTDHLIKLKEEPPFKKESFFIRNEENMLSKEIFSYEFIKTNIIRSFNSFDITLLESEILYELFLNDVLVKWKFSINTTKMIEFKTKEKIPQKIVYKPLVKSLKRSISKEYILELAKEVAKLNNISLSKVGFLGFYVSVPVGRKVKYYWKDNYLICSLDGNENDIEFYYDSAVFIDSLSNKRYIKYIRR